MVTSLALNLQKRLPEKQSYILKHLSHHLYRAKRFNGLFALARDHTFISAQIDSFPKDPNLSLQTFRLALRGASEADDGGAMAEFLLSHAGHVQKINEESPLKFLRVGNLERAWQLADLYDLEHSVLWHLVLAWELGRTNHPKEAGATIQRILSKKLFKFEDWPAECATLLLQYIDIGEDNILSKLYKRLLNKDDRDYLYQQLLSLNCFKAALQICDTNQRDEVLRELAEYQAKKENYSKALKNAEKIQDKNDRAWALEEIAIRQAKAGMFESVTGTIRMIKKKHVRGVGLAEIGRLQAIAGKGELARKAFSDALLIVNVLKKDTDKCNLMEVIANSLADIGPSSLNKEFLFAAMANAKCIGNAYARALSLSSLADAMIRIAMVDLGQEAISYALDAVQKNMKPFKQASLLRTIAEIRVKAKDVTGGLSNLNEAVEAAKSIRDKWDRSWMFGSIAKVQAKVGDLDSAINTTEEIEHVDRLVDALTDIVKAYVQMREYPFKALRMIKRLKLDEDRKICLNLFSETQAEEGDYSGALRTARMIKDDYDRTRVYRKIIKAQLKTGAFDIALETLKKIEHKNSRFLALMDVAEAQAKSGNFKAAKEITKKIPYPYGKSKTLVVIAKAQIDSGLNENACTTLVNALGIVKDIEEVEYQLEEITDIVESLAEIGCTEEAISAVSWFLGVSRGRRDEIKMPESEWVGILREAYAPDSLTNDKTDNELARTIALGWIAEVQVEKAKHSDVLETVSFIKSPGQRDTTFGELAKFYRELGDTDSALELTKHIEDVERRDAILKDLARVYIADKKFGIALEVSKNVTNTCICDNLLMELIEAQIAVGEFEGAINSAKLIENAENRDSILSSIADSQGKRGKLDDLSLENTIAKNNDDKVNLSDTINTAKRIEDPSTKGRALEEIVKSQIEVGNLHKAFHVAKSMVHPYFRNSALQAVAKAQAESGDFEAAFKTTKEIKRLSAWSKRELKDPATIAESLSWIENKALTIAMIAKIQAFGDSKEKAQETFDVAVTITKEIADLTFRSRALKEIAEKIADALGIEQAKETLVAASKIASQIKDVDERIESIVEIAQLQTKNGMFEEALQIIKMIQKEQERGELLKKVAVAQAKAGLGSNALVTSEAISIGADEHLVEIGEALAKAGDKENFKQLLFPSAYYLNTSYQMCGLLVRLYPEKDRYIADIIRSN